MPDEMKADEVKADADETPNRVVILTQEMALQYGLNLGTEPDRIVGAIWADLLSREEFKNLWDSWPEADQMVIVRDWRDFARKEAEGMVKRAVTEFMLQVKTKLMTAMDETPHD